jgi:acyl-CoA thioesterase FadM
MQELAFTEMQGVTATRTLSCSFERPLTLPTVVMARAWAEEKPKTASRKIWVRCQIIDGDGYVFVCGRSFVYQVEGQAMSDANIIWACLRNTLFGASQPRQLTLGDHLTSYRG